MFKHNLTFEFLITALILWNTSVSSQNLTVDHIMEKLKLEGQVDLKRSEVTIIESDYLFQGRNVEAISFKPLLEGKYPGIFLIPGYSRTACDYIPLGIRLARAGYTCIAITQPGFGRSQGDPDFAGPTTIATLEKGIHYFSTKSFVDTQWLAIYGYSRGAMAASLLATRLKQFKAAVFAAGIYDLEKAYLEIRIDGIRKNIEREAGLSDKSFTERSSILMMDQISCPVLILHGEQDENTPVSQALYLRDKLSELGKEFEIEIYEERAHNVGMQNLLGRMMPFLKKHLSPEGQR